MTAANTPQTPKSATRATNRPDVAPSASGALTDDERANLLPVLRKNIGAYAVVESLIAARVDAALAEVVEDIRARRREFARLGADGQYLAALDDAFGLARNRQRAALDQQEDHR